MIAARRRFADDHELDGERRDEAAMPDDDVAVERDRSAAQRYDAGYRRDDAADARDVVAGNRDRIAEQRDRDAVQNEHEALGSDPSSEPGSNRESVTSNRRRATGDRRAAAQERDHAAVDRSFALADRVADSLELERRANQLRKLLAELVTAEQNERSRIAEGLHDESVQLLAAAQLRLQLLVHQLDTGDSPGATQSAHDSSDLVISALTRLRETLIDLEPPTGPDHTLHESLADAGRQLFAGSEVELHVYGELTDPTREAAAVLYRAAREALANTLQHAHATAVTVTLAQDADTWTVAIQDNGIGMPPDVPARRGHLGLSGMRSRVEALGGSISIGPAPGGGTRTELRVPRPE